MALLNRTDDPRPSGFSHPPLEGVLTGLEFGRLAALLLGTAGFAGVVSSVMVSVRGGAHGFHPMVVGAISGAALVACLVSLRWAEYLYPTLAGPLLAVTTVLITIVAYYAGAAQGPYATFFYLWVGTAFVVLPVRPASVVVGLSGVLHAGLLAMQKGHPVPLAAWQFSFGVTVLTAFVVKRVVDILVELARNERAARAAAERGNEQLERLSARQTEFLSRLSHEVRNPLNVIIGFADMLGEGLVGELNDKQSEYVGEVRGSGRHLLGLVDDVVDMVKVASGRDDLTFTDMSLDSVLVAAGALFRPAAERDGIRLEVNVPGELRIVADERRVRQVVLNLLSNAVKFTPSGGAITVTATVGDDVVDVAVTDTGHGIAQEDQERIFEEYRQVAGGRGAGTGLGLPLARRYAELHGGSLDVRSETAAGSTFTLRLPLRGPGPEVAAEPEPNPPTRAWERGSRWRPLDNPDLRARLVPLPPLLGIAAVALGCVTLICQLFDRSSGYQPGPLLGLALVAAVIAAVASGRPHRILTSGGMSILILVAVAGFTLAAYFVGAPQQPYAAMLYIWVGVAAVSFVGRAEAVPHLIFVAISYGVLVAVQKGNPLPVAGWIVVMSGVIASSLAVETLLARLGGLADAERDARDRLEGVHGDLELASQHRTRVIATISHELRTPLNAIIGFSEVLGDELFGTLSPKQAEYVADLTEAGHQLLAIVNDVLDLTKIDAGRMELDLVDDVDVAEALRAACSGSRAERTDIVLGAVTAIRVDARKFARMVTNLIDEESGTNRRVEVRATTTSGWLTVEVTGDGARHGRVAVPAAPLRVTVADAFAEMHGGRVEPALPGWRLALPVRAAEIAPGTPEPV